MGVTIGVASIVVMVSLGLGLSRSLTKEMENFGILTCVNVRDASYYYYGDETSNQDKSKHLDDEAVKELLTLPNVTEVIPILSIDIMVKAGQYSCEYITLSGVPEGYLESQNVKLKSGNYPKENGIPQILYGNTVKANFYNPKTQEGYWYNGVMADLDFSKDAMMYILDMDAYWAYQSGVNETEGAPVSMPKKYIFETCGEIAGGPEDYTNYSMNLYCNIHDLEKILKKDFKNKIIPGQPVTKTGKPYKELYYTELLVMTDSIDHVTDLQTEINGMGYSASSNAEFIAEQQKTMGYIQLVLGGIGAVSLLVAAIGITNTMMMSIYERTKEIGIMKVLGCDMRNIQAMFLMESGFIGFIGGLIGLIISYILSIVVNSVAKGASGALGITGDISYIPIWLALLSIGFAVLVGVVAGFFPSLRAMKLSPLAAIRNE